MAKQLVIYLILLLSFSAGAIYHYRIRKQCIYSVKLTKPRALIIVITFLIFLAMAYYVGDRHWSKYLIAISASMFITSGVLGEGISQRGIYYRPLGTRRLMALAKWEEIKDIRIDANKNKLESFKLKTQTIFPGQYYSSKDIDEINKYIEKKIEKRECS